jgi:hypothetical protein
MLAGSAPVPLSCHVCAAACALPPALSLISLLLLALAAGTTTRPSTTKERCATRFTSMECMVWVGVSSVCLVWFCRAIWWGVEFGVSSGTLTSNLQDHSVHGALSQQHGDNEPSAAVHPVHCAHGARSYPSRSSPADAPCLLLFALPHGLPQVIGIELALATRVFPCALVLCKCARVRSAVLFRSDLFSVTERARSVLAVAASHRVDDRHRERRSSLAVCFSHRGVFRSVPSLAACSQLCLVACLHRFRVGSPSSVSFCSLSVARGQELCSSSLKLILLPLLIRVVFRAGADHPVCLLLCLHPLRHVSRSQKSRPCLVLPAALFCAWATIGCRLCALINQVS